MKILYRFYYGAAEGSGWQKGSMNHLAVEWFRTAKEHGFSTLNKTENDDILLTILSILGKY